MVLTHEVPPAFHEGVHKYTVNRQQVSRGLSGHILHTDGMNCQGLLDFYAPLSMLVALLSAGSAISAVYYYKVQWHNIRKQSHKYTQNFSGYFASWFRLII